MEHGAEYYLCGGCGSEDDVVETEPRRGVPAALSEKMLDAIRDPQLTLGLDYDAEPWDVRDRLRENCLLLLAAREEIFERNLIEKKPVEHSVALAAAFLCDARARHREEIALRRLPRLFQQDFFTGDPIDILHRLRPSNHSFAKSRGSAMLKAFFCGVSGDEDSGFALDIQVFYCMRQSRVAINEKQEAGFRSAIQDAAGHDNKLSARRMKLLERILYAKNKIPANVRGRALARLITATHSDLADLGLFSPELLGTVLKIDFDRIFREEEPRLVTVLQPKLKPLTFYTVDDQWLKTWRTWVAAKPQEQHQPPGPVPKGKVKLHASLFHYLKLVHGTLSKEHEYRQGPLPRPVAIARIHTFFHTYFTHASMHTVNDAFPHELNIVPTSSITTNSTAANKEHCAITVRRHTVSQACIPPRRRRRREPSYDELELIRLDFEDVVSPLHHELIFGSSNLQDNDFRPNQVATTQDTLSSLPSQQQPPPSSSSAQINDEVAADPSSMLSDAV